jgi:hypothetical protein
MPAATSLFSIEADEISPYPAVYQAFGGRVQTIEVEKG